MYAEMAEHTKRGDLWNFIWQNVTLGQKASLLWAVGAGRYVQTCGLFMLGMLIGRRKLFISSEENSRFLDKDFDNYRNCFRSFIPTESIVDGYGG